MSSTINDRASQSLLIAVVGSGYVGLVAAACFAELGHEVICVDSNPKRVEDLKRGIVPIFEDILPELIHKHNGNRLTFTTDTAAAVRASSAIFIAVGTPSMDAGQADLSYVESVVEEIARSIDSYKVIVEKSTVPVHTGDWIARILLRNGISAEHFDVVSNPEFLREGTAVTDFMHPDRIVVGTGSDRAWEIMRAIYLPLADGSYYTSASSVPGRCSVDEPALILRTSTSSSELIKHSANAFLAMKISFINSVANVCEAVGADIQEVAMGLGTDRRIGKAFLSAGIGYGGSCFPKDVKAFCSVGSEFGVDLSLLKKVKEINCQQRERFLHKVRTALWTLRGKKLGVLGLAFKGGTDDVRESPALAIISSLLSEGCTVVAHDPAAIGNARRAMQKNGLTFAEDPYTVADDADALLILTDWNEFAQLDYADVKSRLKYPIVLDGRNLLNPYAMASMGFNYISVGRPSILQSHMQTVTQPHYVEVSR
ncbi:MAG: UDP-glucose dehydrogenase family protein [Acidobacteriaceae bacterium]